MARIEPRTRKVLQGEYSTIELTLHNTMLVLLYRWFQVPNIFFESAFSVPFKSIQTHQHSGVKNSFPQSSSFSSIEDSQTDIISKRVAGISVHQCRLWIETSRYSDLWNGYLIRISFLKTQSLVYTAANFFGNQLLCYGDIEWPTNQLISRSET